MELHRSSGTAGHRPAICVTGVATSNAADPGTGAVSGTTPSRSGRAASDVHDDQCAHQRDSRDRRTTGAYTYTPTQVARQNAAQAHAPVSALSDSFTVTVRDGAQLVSGGDRRRPDQPTEIGVRTSPSPSIPRIPTGRSTAMSLRRIPMVMG